MRVMLALLVTSAALAGCATASAPPAAEQASLSVPYTTPVSPQLQALIDLPQHRLGVLGAAQATTGWVRTACANASYTPLPGAAVWVEPQFNADGAPVSGLWRESVIATGCGTTRILNAATFVSGPNVAHTMPVAPGTTRAKLALQMDSKTYVMAALQAAAPGCATAYLDNTAAVSAQPKSFGLYGAATGAPWVENWTLKGCAVPATVQITFTPDATGTEITAHAL